MFYVQVEENLWMCPEGGHTGPVPLNLDELIETLQYCKQEGYKFPEVKTGHC